MKGVRRAETVECPRSSRAPGVSPRFIRRLVAERRIPYLKLGRHVRFDPADLDAFLSAGRVEPEDLTPSRTLHSQR
jgi:excisionase family DNA binding protein